MTVVCVCVPLFPMAKAVGKRGEQLDTLVLAEYTWYFRNTPMWGCMDISLHEYLWGSAEALELRL